MLFFLQQHLSTLYLPAIRNQVILLQILFMNLNGHFLF